MLNLTYARMVRDCEANAQSLPCAFAVDGPMPKHIPVTNKDNPAYIPSFFEDRLSSTSAATLALEKKIRAAVCITGPSYCSSIDSKRANDPMAVKLQCLREPHCYWD